MRRGRVDSEPTEVYDRDSMPEQTPRRRQRDLVPQDKVCIDFAILGDFAQMAAGKLTIVGAGWTVINAQQYPQMVPFGLGIGISIPWTETNRQHPFTFTIQADNGAQIASGGGQVEAGRQPGMPVGMTQRATLGIAGQFQISGSGTYRVIVTAGEDSKTITFEAMPAGGGFQMGQ